MPPKKTRSKAAAAAVPPAVEQTPTKRAAAASPAKLSTTPSPKTQSVTTPIKRSPVAGSASPTPSSSSMAQGRRRQRSQLQSSTPERERSQSTVKQARGSSFAATPRSTTPAPSKTPQRSSSASPTRLGTDGNAAKAKANGTVAAAVATSTSASPVRPAPPPPSPAPHERVTTSPPPPPQSVRPKKRGSGGTADCSVSPHTARVPTEQAKEAPAVAVADSANLSVSLSAAAAGAPKASKSGRSRSVRRSRARALLSASSSPASLPDAHFVERFIRESKVIAPDVSGIRCLAVHPSEQEVVVARENGSLVLYDVSFFQGIPQFVQRRHTGGQSHRTISGLAYVSLPAPVSSSASKPEAASFAHRNVLLASMMSGQIVVYDAELLVPVALHQRSGGAIWALHVVSAACVYAAMADGSWQQLRLTCKRDGAAPQLDLVRVVPGISGADRALSVTTSQSLSMAVGTDDAGNVHAWRLPAGVSSQGSSSGVSAAEEDGEAAAPSRSRGLAEHDSLWTTKLAKGIALSCAVVGGTQRPCVVVGTSMGDVVLLDAAHGHVFQTFSQHKGPVSTLVVQGDAVVFASGWHESLRSYRCSEQGDWYPAEVKRRTHYHEASQLALLPSRKLILSASRDGTIMYASTAQLFTSPAMYVVASTQQFAYATGRDVLLQSRFDTIEAFHMDSAGRHWVPFFGHRLDGRFHLSGLWCDRQLDYVVFATEERLGLLKVVWRAHAAMSVSRLEVVVELPARSGVVDICWSGSAGPGVSDGEVSADASDETAADMSASLPTSKRLYILYDDSVTCVTLADGYPVVHTPVQVRGKMLPGDSLRPYQLFCRPIAAASLRRKGSSNTSSLTSDAKEGEEIVIYGHRGSCRMRLMLDGTPDASSLVFDLDDVYTLVQELPLLQDASSKDAQEGGDSGAGPALKRPKSEVSATSAPAKAATSCEALVGLSTLQQRYVVGPTLHSSSAASTPLSATLPHDVRWIARIAVSSSSRNNTTTTTPASSASAPVSYKFLGYFSRGLLLASGDSWHMVRRMCVEAAFLVKDGTEVLVLERNLEKTLESLPLCWKVRRFGN
ncbi:hypothetical protein JKF63_04622 [Porcisia hertigi]|uniref:Uncharacterized protein n=1 Tax=Porcisia hertigi TaxID=2761500 RepID=A0A836LAF4_9TRYP|nr:hypothetical protein JKF63_04622 [Porcisia hertigi]